MRRSDSKTRVRGFLLLMAALAKTESDQVRELEHIWALPSPSTVNLKDRELEA